MALGCRKILYGICLLFLTKGAYAFDFISFAVDRTSFTQAVVSGSRIVGAGPGDSYQGLNVGFCGPAGSSVTVFDSSGTYRPVDRLFAIDLGSVTNAGAFASCPAAGTQWFFIQISSGITYQLGGGSVTHLWYNKNRSTGQD